MATMGLEAQELNHMHVEMMRRALHDPLTPPGSSTFYCSGKAAWSPDESKILEDCLQTYPTCAHSSFTRYIKTAALLPHKSVRDVAARIQQIAMQRSEFGMEVALPAQGKRARVEQQGWAPVQREEPKAQGRRPTPPQVPHAASAVATPGAKDVPPQVLEFIQGNEEALNMMRDNLLHMRVGENIPLMRQVYVNASSALSMLSSLPVNLPPLPLSMDTRLLQMPGGAMPPFAM